jgi:hypothetical protein
LQKKTVGGKTLLIEKIPMIKLMRGLGLFLFQQQIRTKEMKSFIFMDQKRLISYRELIWERA